MKVINLADIGKFEQVVWNGEETKYMISEYGYLYDTIKKTFCHPSIKYKTSKRKEYYIYNLVLNKGVRQVYIHQLVANAFLPKKPEGYIVDHIDEDSTNNHYTNLQWLTIGQNAAKSLSKEVVIYLYDSVSDGKGEMVGTYPSIMEASRKLQIHQGNLTDTANKKRNHCAGFVAEYQE
jgi:hypothetical protein